MAALRSLLEQQVDELELLQSIFSAPGEFQIDDQTSFERVSVFLKDLIPGVPGRLSYSLHIPIDAHHSEDGGPEVQPAPPDLKGSCSAVATQQRQHIVDVSVKLPHGYV